ncbi:MAG: M23 family metallopeptidase [Clostridia bacterium]|nr:M23 family metallopeptidase [Clostridia bacterium]
MASSGKKKEAGILYFCFIILLVAALAVAAVMGIGKKSSSGRPPISGSVDTGEPEQTKDTKREEAGIITRRPSGAESERESETEPAKEPTSLTPAVVTFVSPVNGVLYNAFSDKTPVFSPTMEDYRTHMGVDVAAAVGDPVFAVADGEIEEIFDDPMMGKTVVLLHADGTESIYRNLNADLPAGIVKGVSVTAGQTIAAIGGTALIECEDEPHLHFEMRQAGVSVDPESFITFAKADTEFEG